MLFQNQNMTKNIRKIRGKKSLKCYNIKNFSKILQLLYENQMNDKLMRNSGGKAFYV